jgi:hypothetical protein
MPTESNIAYSKRLDPTASAILRVRLESRLTAQIKAAQDRPELLIKDTHKPSTSLIVRRAVALYLAGLLHMTPEELNQEGLELHKLA